MRRRPSGARKRLAGLAARMLDTRLGAWAAALGARLLHVRAARRVLVRAFDRRLVGTSASLGNTSDAWHEIHRQRSLIYSSVVHSLDRAIDARNISPQVLQVAARLWGRTLLAGTQVGPAVEEFRALHGQSPPWFLVISPGHACNLRCEGCYATAGQGAVKLEWSVLDRIMSDAREHWGVRLFVLSGGEPLLYRSQGRDILDAVEKHDECLFLMFTNGTLIGRSLADRIARLGNLTPALSVEGFRRETDARRGAGTYEQVLHAMASLRAAGVPFGVSLTATRDNCDRILSDEVVDFYFGEQGAFYGFVFPYSPIGTDSSMEWIPTPAQSIAFLRRSWQLVETKRIFLLDFWNHGPLVEGCIAAGRDRGYLYIDWNANVMPCVFLPYAAANIRDVYAQGGSLEDAWAAPFLTEIRRWQRDHGYAGGSPTAEHNWLSPCPFRDHYGVAREMIERADATPEDEAAANALADVDYCSEMVAYGIEARRLRSEVWRSEYIVPQAENTEGLSDTNDARRG